ncbi:MAG: hypothetical protein LW689_03245 [Novosphingobium sp.]|nr:hypothetical protein [Novosphingobium sp.]
MDLEHEALDRSGRAFLGQFEFVAPVECRMGERYQPGQDRCLGPLPDQAVVQGLVDSLGETVALLCEAGLGHGVPLIGRGKTRPVAGRPFPGKAKV